MNEMSRLDSDPDSQLPDARRSIGANHPPAPLTVLEVRAWLDDAYSGLTGRRDEIIEAIDLFLKKYPTIDNADVAAAATENLEMARKAIKVGEDQRKIAKAPYWDGGLAVDAWFKAVRSDIEAWGLKLAAPATAWAEKQEEIQRAAAREAARVAQVEADRVAALAAAAAEAAKPQADGLYDTAIKAAVVAERAAVHAEAKPGVHSRTVGTYGSTSSLKEVWSCEVVDSDLVPLEHKVVDQASLNRAVARGVREIAGCVITSKRVLGTRS